MDLITPGIGLIFWTTLVFVSLLLLLRKYAWKPILNTVNERQKSIEEALGEAKKAKEEILLLKTENDSIIKNAKLERDSILKEARELKEKIIAEAKEEAKVEADKMIEIAKNAIQNEKMSAITEIKNQIGQLSINVAESVLGRELSENNKQEKLIQDIVSNMNLS